MQAGLPLHACELGGAHRPAELPVAGAVASQEAKARAVGQHQFGADDRLDARLGRSLGELDGTVEAIAIADGHRTDAELGGGCHQGARRGRPFQEGVVRTGSQLGEQRH